jgi:hypothetical protein
LQKKVKQLSLLGAGADGKWLRYFQFNQQRSIRIQSEELIEWNEKQNRRIKIKDVSMELQLKIYEKISLAKLQNL